MKNYCNINAKALIFLFLGATAISLAPILVRLSELGPIATVFYRVFFALPVLSIWTLLEKRSVNFVRQPSSPKDYLLLTLAGLFFAGDLSLWHWSIKLTSIANSTLLANFAPVFITIGGFCLFGERFTRLFLFGMMLALVGVFFLLGDSLIFGRTNIIGDALGLLAALFYGAYLMTVSRLRIHFSTVTIMTWSGTVTCVFIIPITLIFEDTFLAVSLAGWLVLIVLALIPQLCGQSLIAFSLAHLPAAFSSVSLLLQPVIATFIAWLVFNEEISVLQAAGGLIILMGIYASKRGSK